ncbi:MAG TPA: acyltransferase [Acidimicrobiales bacterium]|nr:acyltransferase [Acidimicrobiales bacterium]
MFKPSELSPPLRDAAAGLIQRMWGWIVDVGAVSPDDALGKRFGYMGPQSMIAFPPGSVFGEQHIHIGARTLIGAHVSMSVGMAPGQPVEHDVVIRIGERCNIGRGSFVVGHRSIEIGDDVTTGPYVYITDQNHVYADVNTPIADQWPEEDPVTIGSGCWLGANVIVLPGAHIGDNVAVAAGSIVRGTLPDRCVAAGAPAKVVRRYENGEWNPPLREMSINPPAGWPGATHSSSSPAEASSVDS